MGERGVAVDHSTLNRWVIKYAPEFEKQFRRRQLPVGRSWLLDETSVKIKGKWAYLSRAVDKEGHTIDFLLTPQRDRDAAEAFLCQAFVTRGSRKRSPSTGVVRIRQRLRTPTRLTRRPSSSATLTILTISWNRTTAEENKE
jgi:putative transposase